MREDRQVMERGVAVSRQERLTAAGVTRTFLASSAPYRDEHGRVVGVVGIARDISDRDRTEKLLRAERDRFEKIVEAVPVVICSYQWLPDGGICFPFSSRGVEQIYGLTPAELAVDATPILQLIHPDDHAHVSDSIAVSAKAMSMWRSEFRVRSPRLGEIWIEGCSSPVSGPDGSVIWHGYIADITARKRKEEAFHNIQRQLRESQQMARLGSWSWDADTGRIWWSDEVYDLIGQDPARGPLSLAAFLERVHPQDRHFAAARLRAWEAGENRFAGDFRVMRPNGETIWIHSQARAVRDETGRLLAVEGFDQDINERKNNEIAMRESGKRFRSTFEQAAVGIAHVSLEGKFLRVNERFADITRRDRDELMSLTFQQITHPDDLDGDLEKIAELMGGRTDSYSLEKRYLRKDGSVIWVNLTVSLRRDPDAEPVYFISVIEDVTQRKKAEEDAREAREMLRLVLDTIPQGVFWKDRDSRYLGCNEVVARSMGLAAPANVVGMTDADWHFISPKEAAFFVQKDREVMETGFPQLRIHETASLPDGQTIVLETNKLPLRDASGRVIGILGTWENVTERLRVEQALRESEERQRLAIQVARVGVVRIDYRRQTALLSERAGELFGLSAGRDIPRQRLHELFHPEDRERLDRLIDSTLDPSGPGWFEAEHRVIRPDLTVRWLSVRKQISFEEGTPVRALLVAADVTDRREIEEHLRESEERFRAMAEGLAAPLFVHDEFGNILFQNPGTVRTLGYSHEELAKMKVLDIDVTWKLDQARVMWDELMARPANQKTFETTQRRKDGSVFPVEVRLSVIPWLGKMAILASVRDLTERKKVEMQLRHQEMLIREAAEMAHVGGWGFDPVTMEADWTPEVARIHDLQTDVPVNVDEGFNYYCGEDRNKIEAAIQAAITTGAPCDLELQFLSAKGVQKWVRTTCKPIIEHGRVVRVRGSLQDITDRKLLEEQFRQAQKMEAVGRLAGGIAHDFNNLLTVINGYCDLILSDLDVEDAKRPLITEVYEAGERAAGLTAQLLAFSRKAVVAPKILDLKDVVSSSDKLLRRLIGEDIILSVVSHQSTCRIEADPNQLDQVIMNLAVNARDAMPQGGRLVIESNLITLVRSRPTPDGDMPPGRYVELSMTDTGTGMSKEVQAKIFEPFFTTKEIGSGTGLGLAVVHGVVRQAGGHIFVESELGRGATFRLYFPEVPEPEADATIVPRIAPSRGTEMVLLVEDDEAVRALSCMALESQGYRVVAAPGGREAIAALDGLTEAPAILVTDVVMPGMSGRELAEAIRQRLPEIPVLYVSGYTDDTVLRHGVEQAKDAFLQKPFSPLGLARRVRAILDAIA